LRKIITTKVLPIYDKNVLVGIAICYFSGMAILFILGWAMAILIFGFGVPPVISIFIVSPAVIYMGVFSFQLIFVAFEGILRVLGVYRILGVSGNPLRDAFFSDEVSK